MKNVFIIVVMLLGTHSVAFAGNVADVFSESILELKWLSSKEEVIEKYPQGKIKTNEGITRYEIKDGRKLFGVERKPRHKITFGFNAYGQLSSVGINFSMKSFGKLINNLNTFFGPSETPVPNSSGASVLQWPIDNGIQLTLMTYYSMMGSLTTVSIVYNTPIGVDKEDLGF